MPPLKLLPLFPLLVAASLPLQAAQNDLDSALQGFDEPAPASSPANSPASDPAGDEEALQGFDEQGGASELEAVLGGFEGATKNGPASAPSAPPKSWHLGGALTLGTAWNYAHEAPAPAATDYRGLSRLRAKLNLEHDADLGGGWRSHLAGYGYYDLAYQLNGRDNYSDEVLDEYEGELELGEAWLQGKLGRQTDLKLGRQIVVWGKSDNLRVTDLINPMDNREPGMVDIEELRLPLAMARIDHYIGDWGISALAIPEPRFNKNPPFGSDFYPLPTAMPDEAIPGGTEYALAANGIFSGWDLSLYRASLYDDNPYRVATPSGPELQHARLQMIGGAINVASGNWLLKGELARLGGLRYSTLPTEKFTRTDTLLGVEYSGLRDTTLSLEVVNRHLDDFASALQNEGIERDEWQSALRYQGDFMHARLHLLAVITAFGEHLDGGGFGRYSAAYDLRDALTVTGGVVSYDAGEKMPFAAYDDNDRLFIDLKYSF